MLLGAESELSSFGGHPVTLGIDEGCDISATRSA